MKGLLVFLMTSGILPCFGQLQLLIEKAGNPKSERIHLYDELKFQLKDDEAGWYKRPILDMDAIGQMLLLGDAWIPLTDISRIHLKRQRIIPNVIGGALAGGGATMILGDIWYTLRGNHRFTEGGMEFGLLNIAVGTGLKAALAPIKYRIGGNKRLRVVDLTF